MKLRLLSFLSIICLALAAKAQILDPVTWTSKVEMTSPTEGVISYSATIEPGWHLYSTSLPEGGPNPTSITYDVLEGVELIGELSSSEPPIEKVDMVFHLKLGWWTDDVTLSQPFRITADSYRIEGSILFQGCNDESCIPPSREPFSFSGGASAPAPSGESPAPEAQNQGNAEPTDLWTPVDFSAFSASDAAGAADLSNGAPWWYIFLWGFVGGLVALLTPCVWPMIPLTVSFFLKKGGKERGKAIRDALTYGVAIIVIYLVLGLAITLIFGASKLNDLATNAVFNLAFFLLLVVFAISFFGAFDIKLPSKWSNSVDSKAETTTGLLSIFFMAFTLALVSFSCTGPIIGTLLVEAASDGNIAGPAIGMGAFALALAIPFTLFAVFPSWLQGMPRSGGWLNSVKVILGFLELALSLKFLSVADLAYGWGILDREVFVSLWVVIFTLLGLYLLGKIRFSHDSPQEHVGIMKFFMALISLAFAVYLLPGLWGAPLKSVSAFVPPLYTQDFNLYAGGQFREYDDYDEGMAFAAESGRPVLIDFSGYGCVNCRKMEGAVFDTEEISSIIRDNFVLIKLMVDDKTALSEPITVEDGGKSIRLSTVGEKWSFLQRHKFAANSQPYYVMVNGNGQPLASPYYYDESVEKFAEWLDSGIKKFAAQ
ncbi:MAG: thioredoxin family protein [Pseudoflavonifractor sp.]|nr:thioredoxin family protein [Alloprevotella sp.]MCM1117295.1 thioredoxin family protein [Pseudoflavonifractor sp.]